MSSRQPSALEVAQLGVVGSHAVLSLTFGIALLPDLRGVALLLLGAVWGTLTYVVWVRGARWRQAALVGVVLAATGVFQVLLGQHVSALLGLTWLVLILTLARNVRLPV